MGILAPSRQTTAIWQFPIACPQVHMHWQPLRLRRDLMTGTAAILWIPLTCYRHSVETSVSDTPSVPGPWHPVHSKSPSFIQRTAHIAGIVAVLCLLLVLALSLWNLA